MKNFRDLLEGSEKAKARKKSKTVKMEYEKIVSAALKKGKIPGSGYQFSSNGAVVAESFSPNSGKIKIVFQIESKTGLPMEPVGTKITSIFKDAKVVMNESDHKHLFRPGTELYDQSSAWFTITFKL
jgi:hypothetical protein